MIIYLVFFSKTHLFKNIHAYEFYLIERKKDL